LNKNEIACTTNNNQSHKSCWTKNQEMEETGQKKSENGVSRTKNQEME
jgi:hypothetical protein